MDKNRNFLLELFPDENNEFQLKPTTFEEFNKINQRIQSPFEISKGEVVHKNFSRISEALKIIQMNGNDQIYKFRSALLLLFDGYNDDPRPIFKIPAICHWVKKLVALQPHLFYFLSEVDNNMRFVFYCLISDHVTGYDFNHAIGKHVITFDESDHSPLAQYLVKEAVSYAKSVNEPLETQFALAQFILKQVETEFI